MEDERFTYYSESVCLRSKRGKRGGRRAESGKNSALLQSFEGSSQRSIGYEVKGLAVGRVFQKLFGLRRESNIMDPRVEGLKGWHLQR